MTIKIENATKSSVLTVGKKVPQSNRSNTEHYASKKWGGMYFRSLAEVAIAEELDKRDILLFGNVKRTLKRERFTRSPG